MISEIAFLKVPVIINYFRYNPSQKKDDYIQTKLYLLIFLSDYQALNY